MPRKRVGTNTRKKEKKSEGSGFWWKVQKFLQWSFSGKKKGRGAQAKRMGTVESRKV